MLQRIKELKNLGIIDTEEEELFNDIVKTASIVCETPISLITLLETERQWFKAKIGTEVKESPIAFSICNHTIQERGGTMKIKDLSTDQRFLENPFVVNAPNLRSYMGVSLETKSGERIGTVCVIDNKVRDFDEKQIECLRALSRYTMRLVNEKTARRKIEEQNKLLQSLNKNLKSFAHMVAHDVKAPLFKINSFSNLILKDDTNQLSANTQEYFDFIKDASKRLGVMVTNLLEHSKKVQINTDEFEPVNLKVFIEEIITLLDFKKEFLEYEVEENLPTLFFSKPILNQVLQNIISNSIKFRDSKKASQKLKISHLQKEKEIKLIFEDNGIGMSEERKLQAFDLFSKDIRVDTSTGVGLCIVKELLEKVNGKIELESELNKGTTIKISIKN